MQKTVASMEPRQLGRDVFSNRGRHYCWVVLVSGRVEMRSYKILSLPEPRGNCDLLVAVAEAKKRSWEKNVRG